MERVRTGIPGLDGLIEGGIPQKSLVLLSGPSGAGKTIFGMQFLYNAASYEPGIFVSFEGDIERIRETAGAFGWQDLARYEKSGRLRFLRYDPFKLEDILEAVESNIKETGARRVVIDSISAIGLYVRDPPELRRMVLQISSILRKNDCTSLLVSEVLNSREALSRFGVEEFVVDGLLVLHNQLIGNEYERGLNIWKMHATNHSRKIHPYKITASGFVVNPKEAFGR